MAEFEIITRQGSDIQKHYCGDIPIESLMGHIEWLMNSMIEYGIPYSVTAEVKFDDDSR